MPNEYNCAFLVQEYESRGVVDFPDEILRRPAAFDRLLLD